MEHKKRQKQLLNTLLIILLLFAMVALFLTFISSRLEAVRLEQATLSAQNNILQKQIQQKKAFFTELEDKISDIELLIDNDKQHDNKHINTLLFALTPEQKKLIIRAIPSGYPSSSRRITSDFGYRIHPILNKKKFHHGLDFGGKPGTAIMATADGVVAFSGYTKGGYGNLVIIAHNFGFTTVYGHMQKNLKVSSGDFVKKGDIIGYLGNSGRSTGPHLHYEVKFINRILDPSHFITLNISSFNKVAREENRVNWNTLASGTLRGLSLNLF